MKLSIALPLLWIVVLAGFGINSMKASPLIHENDTLYLKTEKHKGYGLFESSNRAHLPLQVEEISDTDELLKVIPSNISSPKLAWDFIDMKPFNYEYIKQNKPEYLNTFINENYPEKIDTANIPSKLDNSFQVIVGTKEGNTVYIVDENGNHDFRDDSIRMLNQMNFDAPTPEPVKWHHWIYNGKEMVKDSSWVIIERDGNHKLKISVAHHLKSIFSVNQQEFEIQCMNWIPYMRFCFDSPIISLTSHNGIKKDSLFFSERLELGEYVKLGNSYYRFEDMTNDGSKITLIKEEDVSDKVSNQIGFIAPDFKCVTTKGDSISLADYKNEYLLLVNVTACWSPIMSYEYYKELSNKYNSRIDILAIDESPNVLQANIDNLGLKGKFIIAPKNRSIKAHYREDYCSRICYLISPSGQIIDKFEISDWELSLAKHIK